MKPPPFRYHDPTTLAEVVGLKAEHGSDAAVLAGGQSLVPMMNLRLAHPDVLIDVNRVDELAEAHSEGGVLHLGATVRQHRLEQDDAAAPTETLAAEGGLGGERGDASRPLSAPHHPLLAEAARFIGHRELRHRGTVGGSIAHADPAAELPCVALALDAEVVAASRDGERVIRAVDFFDGYFTTTLRAEEVVTAVRFRLPGEDDGWGFAEVARRHGDFALAAATAVVRADDGRVTEAAVSLAGVADRPLRAEPVEQALRESASPRDDLVEIARLAEGLVTVSDDLHATRAYRRGVAAVVVERALTAALARAGRTGGDAR